MSSRPSSVGQSSLQTASSAIAIYVRVSTEEQRERQSIATQTDFAKKYCDLHKLDVAHLYSDNGVSGTVPIESRPEGQQILTDARQGRFRQLLIYKLDRLGRDTRMILNAVDELEQMGVRVRSMTEDFDTGTASGRLMLTMLSGFAAHEREVIRERSIAGTKRLAEAGAWLGGIVPFGYRKEGERREARLLVSETEIPELSISEAEIVRRIYQMAASDHLSCRVIAERLNEMHVPCAYTRDDRLLLRGKRRQRTSGIWRGGRVRNMLTNPTYKGLHEYGKRSRCREKGLITREVPAIVTQEIWSKAQTTLTDNFLFGARNAKNHYLLRGLMKCCRCSLTFIGTCTTRPSGKVDFYYRCNGKHSARQLFGAGAKRCTSKDINGTQLETLIWKDVERFLTHPSEAIDLLAEQLSEGATKPATLSRTPEQISSLLAEKQGERNRMLALFRKGRIDEQSLEEQLKEVECEETALRRERNGAVQDQNASADAKQSLLTAQELLDQLRARLEQGISWDLKRQLIETLVDGAEIETMDTTAGREAVVTVRYRFNQFSSDCTGRGSWPQPA